MADVMGETLGLPDDDEQDQPNFSPLALLASGGPLASRVAQRMAFSQGDIPGANATMAPGSGGGGGSPIAATPNAVPSNPYALAPVPQAPDQSGRMAHIQALEQTAMQPAPSKADYKPSIGARVGGALASFGAGWQHNPNAVEVGNQVKDRAFNAATQDWQNQHAQTESQIGQERADMGDEAAQYGIKKSAAEADWARNKDQSEIDKNKATADKLSQQGQHYEDMTAEGRLAALPGLEKSIGRQLNPDERLAFVASGPKGLIDLNKASKTPSNYTEAVIAAQGEKDPNGPLHQSVKEIESHEKSLQPKSQVQPTEFTGWASQFQKENGHPPTSKDIMEFKRAPQDDDGISARQDRALKNDAQYSNLERQLKSVADTAAEEAAMGSTDAKSVQRKQNLDKQMNDLVSQQEARKAQVLGTGNKPAATPAPQPTPQGKPQAGGPPPNLWQGKQDKILTLKNPQSGEQERWQLQNGKPTKVGAAPKQISQATGPTSGHGNNF